ncbi:Membrane-bound lytic murein transglycosylase B precursor [Thalassovita gelatinovora]|uniref:Membrane-bound lytic murein transglycosylase B n=1 Tax=Thalassovita gelatinovora TaxID=53501 RepID=A0A0P1F958_THAGE|nr:lytic murein transglycosylase [Thalassovita gelatinovora]QIZ81232.1 lytic murein transglycosylase [Thalassovita gelatinovora]CUH64659.1 Membrane-bound lytic murein transglycosylase B precursor [Thalassovita gelatinovora]SEP94095.1 membrane-bound lytic murein transglycosylase B [Thalassovita gelatinovora]
MKMCKFLTAVAGLMILSHTAMAAPVDQSLRPQLRSGVPAEKAVSIAGDAAQISSKNMGFQRWLQDFRKRGRAAGISNRTLDQAFRGVRYNADVIQKDRNQSEFTKTLWDYLDSAASDTRVQNGKKALRQHDRTLRAIESKYGVDKEVVAAVWGLESAYGSFRGSINVIEALATLAFDGRRGRFFEKQLIDALKILQSGDTSPKNMTGSWAGAMGHTQFIPSSYLAYAVDFTGDGKRDIWSDNPSDALASTAAYLARFGWTKGQPWGVEVKLPRGFNYALANRKIQKMPSDWARLGVTDMKGRPVRDFGAASVLLPAGAQGAAFLIFKNFSVIERYNTADAYVIGVGHLSDRLKGGPKIQSNWPRGDRALTFAERKEMQKLLTRRGFDTKGVDGKIGPLTIQAVRGYQRTIGMEPDGYASLSILKKLKRN